MLQTTMRTLLVCSAFFSTFCVDALTTHTSARVHLPLVVVSKLNQRAQPRAQGVPIFVRVATSLYAQRKRDPRPGDNRISQKRRKELGIADDEDEYDLEFALEQNTDPLITKVIAGSLIVAIFALLVVGVIIPSTTDFGEGVCSPIQNGGRC